MTTKLSEGDRMLRDIQIAIDRAKTGQNAVEVYRDPGLKRYRLGENTASWRKNGDALEVVHVCGTFDHDTASAFLCILTEDMKEMGVERVQWIGRKGWSRFLRMKGITNGRS